MLILSIEPAKTCITYNCDQKTVRRTVLAKEIKSNVIFTYKTECHIRYPEHFDIFLERTINMALNLIWASKQLPH